MGRRVLPPLLVLLVALLLLSAPSLAFAADAAGKMHPQLAASAVTAPGETVDVIVQKADGGTLAEDLTSALGGRVTRDLSIINAFAAEISAGELVELAASPAVKYVSPDAQVVDAGKPGGGSTEPTAPSAPANYYLDTLRVREVWQQGITGRGIGVAVIDSGISQDGDFSTLTYRVNFNPRSTSVNDVYGHGSHVAGIIAGTGADSAGAFKGIAPGATLIGLKIADEYGRASESDVVAAMQWVLENKTKNNIRVVNLSVNSGAEMSYHESPLDAAAEILWFNKIVVVASAGNVGASTTYNPARAAPANDPFVITVGAFDEKGTSSTRDDAIATFSAAGVTQEGFRKPEVLAPGKDIISVLSKNSTWGMQYPDRVVGNGEYFRLSGTSMAAPMVAAAAALILEDEPGLNPDQVKNRIVVTGGGVKDAERNFWPTLDVAAAVFATTTNSANTGIEVSRLLNTGEAGVLSGSVMWNSVMWNSVMWNSVMWNSVMWNSVMWNSVMWNSLDWSSIMWN